MQSLIRSKSAGVTGGRGTAGAGPGRDLLPIFSILPIFSTNGFVVLIMEDVFIHFLPQLLVFLRASNRC